MPRLDFYQDQEHFVTVRLEDDEVMIGRGPECAIQLPALEVSRIHAVICRDDDGGHLIHDRSWNGTRLNFQRVEEPTRLVAGDRIYIEDYVLIYQPDEEPAEDLAQGETLLHS